MKNILILISFSFQFYLATANYIITGTITNSINSCQPIETSGNVTVQQGASVKIISNTSVLLKTGFAASSNAGTNVKIYISATECCSCGDDFTDARNNKTYPTVRIGEQCWMAKSLNYNASYKPNNSASNLDTYGGLYSYFDYMNGSTNEGAQGVCPSGWHIPTVEELSVLLNNFNTSNEAYNALIDGGSTGFNAKLAGWTIISSMGSISVNFNKEVIFGSSSLYNSDYFYGLMLSQSDNSNASSADIYGLSYNHASSVRCLKDCSGGSLKSGIDDKNITKSQKYPIIDYKKPVKITFLKLQNELIIEGLSDFETSIFDLSGRKVISIKKSGNNVNLSELRPGIYIVQLTSAGKTYKQKIVK